MLVKLEFYRQIFEKILISILMKILAVVAEIVTVHFGPCEEDGSRVWE